MTIVANDARKSKKLVHPMGARIAQSAACLALTS